MPTGYLDLRLHCGHVYHFHYRLLQGYQLLHQPELALQTFQNIKRDVLFHLWHKPEVQVDLDIAMRYSKMPTVALDSWKDFVNYHLPFTW